MANIDPIITIYNALNNGWTETNPTKPIFQTAPIDFRMVEPPIISVYRPKSAAEARFVRAPWRVMYHPITIGSKPYYLPIMPVKVDVALKPNQSLGIDILTAIQQKYNMINEVIRIIVANAYQPSTSLQHMDVDSWWEDDDYNFDPPILSAGIIVRCVLTQVSAP